MLICSLEVGHRFLKYRTDGATIADFLYSRPIKNILQTGDI